MGKIPSARQITAYDVRAMSEGRDSGVSGTAARAALGGTPHPGDARSVETQRDSHPRKPRMRSVAPAPPGEAARQRAQMPACGFGFDAAEAQGQGRKGLRRMYRAMVVEPGAWRSAIGSSRSAFGVVKPLPRHTGAIHAFNLQGRRRLCNGEIVGLPRGLRVRTDGQHRLVGSGGRRSARCPGGGDGRGAVPRGRSLVLAVVDAAGQWEDYRRHCGMHGLPLAGIC